MGVDAGDYDGSGRPSLFVANFQNELHALYRNLSAPGGVLAFRSDGRAAGLARPRPTVRRFRNGLRRRGQRRLGRPRHRQRPRLSPSTGLDRSPAPGAAAEPAARRTEQASDVRFAGRRPATAGSYFRRWLHRSARGLAVGDLDNDGRPDLVISHVNEPLTLLRNESDAGNHWLGVVLNDAKHRDIVGAKLTLEAGSRTLTRFAKGGGSYLSSGDRRLLFGLGGAESVGRLTVAWPWGELQTFDGLAEDRYWQVTVGEPQARQLYERPASKR